MRRSAKVGVWATVGFAILLLPFLGVTAIVASNFVAGAYSLVMERNPTRQELIGHYEFRGEGDHSTVDLLDDGSFTEEITKKNKDIQRVNGTWTSRYDAHDTDLTFSTFVDVSTNAKAFDPNAGTKEVQNFTVLSYKPRLGKTYFELDPDTGDKFLRVGN